jgi:hypothetical protein
LVVCACNGGGGVGFAYTFCIYNCIYNPRRERRVLFRLLLTAEGVFRYRSSSGCFAFYYFSGSLCFGLCFVVGLGFGVLIEVGAEGFTTSRLMVWMFWVCVCVRNVGRGVWFVYTFSTYSVYTLPERRWIRGRLVCAASCSPPLGCRCGNLKYARFSWSLPFAKFERFP